jgi:hypothetical protein
MGNGITDVIGGPRDFLPSRSDRSDEFQKVPTTWQCVDHKNVVVPEALLSRANVKHREIELEIERV